MVGVDEVESAGTRLSRALIDLSSATAEMTDATIADVSQVIAEQACELVDGVQCVVSILDERRPGYFTVVAGAGPWAEAKVGGNWPIEGTLNGRALTSQQVVVTANAAADSSEPTVFSTDGSISVGRLVPILGSEPLPDGRSVLGVLGFWRERDQFTGDEELLIDAFSSQATLHVVGAEGRRVAGMIRDRLSFAQRLGLDLQSSLDPREIINNLLETTLAVVNADRATLSTVSNNAITIEATLGAGGKPTWVGRSYGPEFLELQHSVRQAIEEKRPVISGPFAIHGDAPELKDALSKVKHTLTMPLVTGEEVVGLLVISRLDDKAFGRGDGDVMQLIGGIAALALRNARQYESTREAFRMRSEFLNMAAHELRTPVTVVQGYLDLARRGAFGALPADFSEPLDIVATKTEELGSLVANILDAAQWQNLPPALPFSVFDLRDEVADAVSRAEGRRYLLNGELTYAAPDKPVNVSAPRDYIGRIVDNLINNALSYSQENPAISLHLNSTFRWAELTVDDSGLGIPARFQNHIFEQFFRIDEPPWNQISGTGLGLHLALQYAQLAGGDVTLARSAEGEGSSFVLRLPLIG